MRSAFHDDAAPCADIDRKRISIIPIGHFHAVTLKKLSQMFYNINAASLEILINIIKFSFALKNITFTYMCMF